ncbi:pilus assembly protein PilM [Lutispora saccharofermentans]|uniref:Pilus assembly protein PilM n=1 Tax=Lutispora saccharofermentans TaxID=3024236 RepID=A0ABT1NHL8_9FIRM|nr:pilus assembly protein PilM [Lutispora saccharofermentans]MCQ1529806.1 pilus assembly protein PilM [Lutispora saccharofermentans]
MKLFSLLNKNIISIDLGSYETKIVQGSRSKEEIQINKSFSFNTPPSSYENGNIKNELVLLNSLKEELRKNKVPPGTCYLNIKSSAIITREIPFPVLEDKEIEGLLKYQLPEYLPMDYGKYVIQHKPIGRITNQETEKLNVLVVAIPKDMVDMHYNLVKELGLKPAVLDYQSNGIWKLLKFTDNINGSIAPSEKTIAAIDLGYGSTNITIIDKGTIQTSRVIDLGGQSLDNNAASLIAGDELTLKKSEIEDVSTVEEGFSDYNRYVNIVKTSIEGIMDRIDRIFKYYISKEADNEIGRLLLYGGLSNIKGVDKLFSNYFGISAAVLNTASKIRSIDDINKYINCAGALIRDDEV